MYNRRYGMTRDIRRPNETFSGVFVAPTITRLSSQGDWLRGDPPIVPHHSDMYINTASPMRDLQSGAVGNFRRRDYRAAAIAAEPARRRVTMPPRTYLGKPCHGKWNDDSDELVTEEEYM